MTEVTYYQPLIGTVNLLANAYGGSNPPLPTIIIINDLGSRKALFLLGGFFRAGHFRATLELLGRLEIMHDHPLSLARKAMGDDQG